MKHYHSINSAKKQKTVKFDTSGDQTKNPTVEWVHVSPDKTVFATTEKAVLVDSNTAKLSSLKDANRIAITKNLLDGAIAEKQTSRNSADNRTSQNCKSIFW